MKSSLLVGEHTHRDLSNLLSDKRRLIISGTSNETAKALLISAMHTHNPLPLLLLQQMTIIQRHSRTGWSF